MIFPTLKKWLERGIKADGMILPTEPFEIPRYSVVKHQWCIGYGPFDAESFEGGGFCAHELAHFLEATKEERYLLNMALPMPPLKKDETWRLKDQNVWLREVRAVAITLRLLGGNALPKASFTEGLTNAIYGRSEDSARALGTPIPAGLFLDADVFESAVVSEWAYWTEKRLTKRFDIVMEEMRTNRNLNQNIWATLPQGV